MFKSAYVKLTIWYVAIVMALSLAFSVWVYQETTREIRSGLERLRQPAVIGRQLPSAVVLALEDQLETARQRVLQNLIYLNIFVLGLGAGASYLLAKRTMRPIEEAMQAQNRFTADASHELRTPLAAIKTEIEVFLRAKNPSHQETTELLQSNLEEIDRLNMLAEELLLLAHEPTVQTEPLDLHRVVQKACKRLKALAAKQAISIEDKTETVFARISQKDFEKVITILLDNAIKYSPKESTIMLQTQLYKNIVELKVVDQGIGIQASEKDTIFERFYRTDTSRSKTKVAGHGLGLAIAKKIISSYGGTITVQSVVGKGSVFTVKLPSS